MQALKHAVPAIAIRRKHILPDAQYAQPIISQDSGEFNIMAFFNSAVGVLQTLVVAIGAGLGIWGVINLMEGYGNDNPGANAHVR